MHRYSQIRTSADKIRFITDIGDRYEMPIRRYPCMIVGLYFDHMLSDGCLRRGERHYTQVTDNTRIVSVTIPIMEMLVILSIRIHLLIPVSDRIRK